MCSRLSDSADMTPWEVIEEALVHKKPRRNLQWLADQLATTIQVVHNWKARGVPARRYRDIASVLGINVDQLEGLAPLPWVQGEKHDLSPEVAKVAWEINALPERQRRWVLSTVKDAIELARETFQVTQSPLPDAREDVDAAQPPTVRQGNTHR
jgi:hypothetical protein